MRRSNVALRLQTSLLEEAERVAESEGVALNQLINVAVAEKISALRTEEYFRERSGRATSDTLPLPRPVSGSSISARPSTRFAQRSRRDP
jgi:hypothetical protein